MTEAETAHEIANNAASVARKIFEKGRTAKNAATYREAIAAWESAHDALKAQHDAEARAQLRAERLALVAPRRALRARQTSLFA